MEPALVSSIVLCPEMEWDFRLPRVKYLDTSDHKFGLGKVSPTCMGMNNRAKAISV
ncbi:MAG: hypothetical protein QNJ54_03155 [Prochloraceae cyanobacterium]|nr:hypothetical protein [Prochloraceae cyanobacterium]